MNLSDVQQKLLNGKYDLSVAATGVGAGLLRQLWEVPGASSYLRSFVFPYAGQETADYLGFKPEQYVSEETALELASRAYINARRHAYERGDAHLAKAIGIGVTGSVASKEIHRGDHRIAIAVVTAYDVRCATFYPEKKAGYEARCHDDDQTSGHVIAMLGKCLGFFSYMAGKIIDERLRKILMKRPVFYSDGRREADTRGKILRPAVYLSGSFNPLQDGHKFLAAHGSAPNFGGSFFYRICISHVHKPALHSVEMLDRVAMMKAERKVTPWNYDECNLMFTEGDPLFVDKMKAEPGAIWIMGMDTFERLLDPKWGVAPIDVLKCLYDTGSTFHVVRRPDEQNPIVLVEKILGPEFRDAFGVILKRVNIVDIVGEIPMVRSTDIRKTWATEPKKE